MKLFRLIVLILAGNLLLPAYTASDSEAWNALRSVTTRMSQKRFKAKIHLRMFASSAKKEELENESVSITSFDEWLHYKADEMETYSDKDYIITINRESKVILVNRNPGAKALKSVREFGPMLFDSVSAFYYQLSLVNNPDQVTRTLRFKSKDDENDIEQMEFRYKVETSEPISCTIYYARTLDELLGNRYSKNAQYKPLLEIDYSEFRYLNNLDKKDFDYSSVLEITKSKDVVVKAAYKNFELFNYLKNKRK